MAFLTIAGDCPATGAGYYPAGATATVTFGGACNRSGGTGLRVTSWSLDGNPMVPVLTNGTVSISVSMASSHTLTLHTNVEYLLTLDYGAQLSMLSLSQPTIPGDSNWYDAGTIVTFVGGTHLNGSEAAAWSLDGAPPVQVSGAPDFIASFPMTAPQSLSVVLAPSTPSCPSGNCNANSNFDLTVQTNTNSPSGVWVDGAYFPDSVTFAWPAGSVHNVTAVAGSHTSTERTLFKGWTGVSNSPSPTILLTVSGSGNLTADYSKLYLVSLSFIDASGGPLSPQSVSLSGPTGSRTVPSNLSVWVAPGAQYRITSATWMNWNVVMGNDSTFSVGQPASITFRLAVYPQTVRVSDVYGLPLQGAVVNVTAVDGATFNVTTDSQGVAEFRVPMGLFSATITYLGVSSQVVTQVQGTHDLTATFILSYPLVGTFAVVIALAAGGAILLRLRKKQQGGLEFFSD